MDEIERLPTVAKRLEAMQDERSESQGIISASDAMRLSEPESVLRRDTDSDAVAIVCSVGEPTILTGPGGTGKSWLALMLACAAAEGAVRAEDPIVEANTEAEAAAEATAIAEDTADERAEELAEAWADEDYQYATEVEAAAADAAKVEVDVVAAASLKRLPELAEEIAAIAECEATAMVEAEVAAAAKYAAEARAEAESATRAVVPWETACGLAVRPGPVVLVSYEDRPARITARLRAMETTDAVLERLHIVIEPEPLWRPADKTTGGACVTAAFRSLVERLNALRLWVSNSLSGRRWQLHQVPAVRCPPYVVEVRTGYRVSARHGERRVAVQGRVAPCRVVVGLEVGEFPLQIPPIPEEHLVQKFSPYRADQALYKGV